MTSAAEALTRASSRLATDPAAALKDAERVLAFTPADPRARLLAGMAQRRLGQTASAIDVLTVLAREQPGAFHVHLELGLARTAAGNLASARLDLRRAVSLRPDAREAWFALWDADPYDADDAASAPEPLRFAYAARLLDDQQTARATRWARGLAQHRAESADFGLLLAACLASSGAFEEAATLYEVLLAAHPRASRVWLGYGHVLRALGRREACVRAYRRAVELDPSFGEPHWAIANLKLSDARSDETALRAGLAQPETAPDAEAFSNFAEGGRLMRQRTPYSADAVAEQTAHAQTLLTEDFLAERKGWGLDVEGPIFVVGLPRAGSTLVEQILASHPLVEGAGELPILPRLAEHMTGAGPYPDRIAALTRDQARAIGEAYLDATRDFSREAGSMVVDKLPQNFHHVGLIRLALPGARIIDARRAPMAAGWSAFKQLFARGHAFSYDLHDIGRYYADYARLMDHVDRVAPGAVHRVELERIIEDLEGEVRRLLSACGLAFDPACVAFHANPRPVRTPSSEQVRRPIFREGLDEWRRFEPWLRPLADGLSYGAAGANRRLKPTS
jgi:tetratricopeptide (TPR) repeat protein